LIQGSAVCNIATTQIPDKLNYLIQNIASSTSPHVWKQNWTAKKKQTLKM